MQQVLTDFAIGSCTPTACMQVIHQKVTQRVLAYLAPAAAAALFALLAGTLLWAPLLGAVVLAVLQPTRAEIAARQEAAVEQAVAATEIRMSRQLPVTPVESAAWMNRLMQDMWSAFWQPFLLSNNLSMWQVRCGSKVKPAKLW
jgi:hypothetical protein